MIQRSIRRKSSRKSPEARAKRTELVGSRPVLERREYQRRRDRLAEMMGPGSIAIVPTAPVSIRNRDIEFAYRPDSDFLYLTGFIEPDAVAVLLPGRDHGDFVMFCRERDDETERYEGAHAGLDEACELFGADDAFPISDLDDILPGLMEDRARVYYAMGSNPDFDYRVLGWLNQTRHLRTGSTAAEIVAVDHFLHDMRLYKSAGELRVIREAVDVTVAAHTRAMAMCRPDMMEYELEAELLYEMHRRGCRVPAYPSIVAGGTNACALHYTANRSVLRDGELVLIDAAAEYGFYASDVTRTFPVGGKFTGPQRDLYEVVLAAQLAAIEAIGPKAQWDDPHDAAVETLTQGLVDLGILRGDLDELLAEGTYEKYFMHPTGHWLGLDVHDVGDYQVGGESRMLEPGMTMTVEPGVYIAAGDESVDPVWRGIGIRIEDDVLVTRDGRDVLTDAVPKQVGDIEAIVGQGAAGLTSAAPAKSNGRKPRSGRASAAHRAG